MDKSNDWPSVLKNCGGKEEAIAETAKLADKTRLNAKEEDLDPGRDEGS